MRTVLITGADGLIGSHLTQALKPDYQLKLITAKPVEGETAIQTDIVDMDTMVQACQGVDSVVHLAASPAVDTPWEEILHNNIIGTYTVYEAARRAGVKQVIFASSNHAVGSYEEEYVRKAASGKREMLDHLILAQPDSYYGVSKVFGEAMGAYYANHQGLRVICIRIGWINPDNEPKGDPTKPSPAMWMSHEDFAQMVRKSIEADTVQFDIFYGVSDNQNRFFDLEHAREVLNFEPSN
ncbi:NAD-dependent epimerase [Dictyobacter sp. S3.2.2.5]|uniref:NAD-dependent epimerase n=1 Tax=Dictyobacter halimunensis TaxID=3026934 RepID=A0ABQ6FYH8_9CHLR|nr:NAD-dependent epimerase [Dictyobacter sp. S3.2.2.5]